MFKIIDLIIGNRVSAKSNLKVLICLKWVLMAIPEQKWIKTSKHLYQDKVVKLFILNHLIMKKLLLISSVFCLLLVMNSFSTPSTQIWIPSTDFQKWKTMHLGLDNYIRTAKIDGVRGAGMFDLGLTTGSAAF